jgi:hypothetical protein
MRLKRIRKGDGLSLYTEFTGTLPFVISESLIFSRAW